MIRKIDLEKDYKTLSYWLVDHNKIVIPKELYSDSGFMVDEIVAGFLYKTNSSICLVENFISDPKSQKLVRREAINVLFKTIINEAKNENFKIMYTAVKLDSLYKNLTNLNFIDMNDHLMFRSI